MGLKMQEMRFLGNLDFQKFPDPPSRSATSAQQDLGLNEHPI